MYINQTISVSHEQIADFCRRNHIRRMSLFGSVLRDDFTLQSDVDMLVEFEPGYRIGLIQMAGLENQLSQMVGRKVDLRTVPELSRYFRQDVLASAQVLYVTG